MKASIIVNGEKREFDIEDPDMPVVFILRDILGLKGTKYACLEGICGACTVHLDGEAVRSCQLTLGDIDSSAITTIEGLSADGSHPVQQAWIEKRVPQCGYCQSGQIMQAASFLKENASPTTADMAEAMSANLCRCGTTPRIIEALGRAAELAREAKQ